MTHFKKTFKKIISTLSCAVLAVSCVFGVTACGGGGQGVGSGEIVDAENVLNVRAYSAGYGSSYIYAIKEKFEQTFKTEGYKLNVLPPDADLGGEKFLMDIYSKSGVDVYFCGCNPSWAATSEFGKIDQGSSVLDITDTVLNQKAIKFDGTEEDVKIIDKLDDFEKECAYKGVWYSLPYVQSLGGMAVNKTVLESYNLEIPKTTKELFHCVDVIMTKANEDNVFPFTYSTSGNNYPIMMLSSWMLQYLGTDGYNKFMSMEEADGTAMEKPYQVYGEGADGTDGVFADAIKESLEAMYEVFDYNVASYGSATHDFTTAQSHIMRGNAVFFSVGDWMVNEEFERFKSKIGNVDFTQVPVISALGEKLFGANTEYNQSEANCEKILRTLIDMVDESKEVLEMQTKIKADFDIDLKEKDVLAVCTARASVLDRSECQIWISKNTTKKELAEKFLRFCASEDCGTIIAQNTRTTNPFAKQALADNEYQWFRSVSKILNNKYIIKERTTRTRGWREKHALDAFSAYTTSYVHNKILKEKVTIYDDENYAVKGTKDAYRLGAENMQKEIYKEAKRQFEAGEWKVTAGLED